MRHFLGLCGFPGAFAGFAAALVMATMSAAVAAEDGVAAKPETVTAKPDGAAAKPDGVTAKPDGVAAKSAPPAATAPQGSSKDDPALLGAQLRLGHNLVDKLASGRKAEQPNVIVSPASLAMVFAVLDMGADEQMRAAIRKTLGFRVARGAAKGDLEGLRALATVVLKRAHEAGPLALANMVVFDPASKPYPQALQELTAAGAEASVEDLSKPETISRINDWVKAQTRGLIPAVIEETPQEAGLVAVNALYFKDRWKQPFDPSATRDEKFQVSQGQSINVPMMHSEGRFAFRQDGKFVAAALSYASGDYELVVLTSKDAPLGANEFAGVASWLGGGQDFAMSNGEIALPRFSASGAEELLPVIDALGLAKARKAPGALKGFTATAQTIARVVQKTELRVNEEGTEAAAATAVTTLRSAAPRQYVKMVVDKPFMFALRDKRAGLVLLQGYVAKPAAR
ncbi:serpin family protein [Bradyrhizobium sp. LjRoot220]|uniref:serpin family protein n=1 Tax=Bradyrhizobium sp. LjRoot220 TaxID=3342284 RepID=UPI003ECF0E20